MATATEKTLPPTPRDPRVYHPLDQLRGTIRRYVVIEGILSAFIFLAGWYLLALLLDFGVFKLFTWDWVQDGGQWIRTTALIVGLTLLAGILIFRIIRRLNTELSYPALALVLERRFPKVLGDRLITAVELADVDQAAKYGYSTEMIRLTIDEARERVGTVPVNDVFNWDRLRIMALIAVGLPALVAVGALATHAIATGKFDVARGGWKFYHVSTILAERDVLLKDTPWPRRALLSLENIPERGVRTARDGAPPRLKVKAHRWVYADRTVPDGWRPLLWSDVTESLVGMPVPAVPFQQMSLPEEPTTRSGLGAIAGPIAMATTTTFPDLNPNLPLAPQDWTVDEVWERARENAAIRDKLSLSMGGDSYLALQQVMERLEALADNPAYGRTLRRLDAPSKVEVQYTGTRTAGGSSLNPEGTGAYAGEITGLKEDVQFVVKAEDFRTPQRGIVLVAPPTLNRLARVEYQPAYLHYAPPLIPDPDRPGQFQNLGYSSLRGLRQRMPESALSLTGDKSVFVVPSGTEIVFNATAEEPISNAWVRPKVGRVPGGRPGSAELVPLPIRDGQWFLVDPDAPAGRRPLLWSDLTEAIVQAPKPQLPLELLALPDDSATPEWTVDEVLTRLRNYQTIRENVEKAMGPDSTVALQKFLKALEERSHETGSDRKILMVGKTFGPEFRDTFRITTPVEFDLIYANADGITTTRQILIQVTDDQPPVVEVAPEVIRKVGKVYYVTPRAKIPFNPESYVKDEGGLSKVEYTVTYWPEDSELARSLRAGLVTRALLTPGGPGSMSFASKMVSAYHTNSVRLLDKGDNRQTASFGVAQFNSLENSIRRETKDHLTALLNKPLASEKPELVKKVPFKTELVTEIVRRANGSVEEVKRSVRGDYFDIKALDLEVQAGDIQPRYRIDLNIQATDTNYDTGPKSATNSPDMISLLVISSGDLLVEIGREEEALGAKLDEALAKLIASKKSYEFVRSKNGYVGLDEVDAVKVRSKGASQEVTKARDIVQAVGREFRRIERECVVNQIDEKTIVQYGKFANRIDRILGENPSVVSTDEYDQLQTGRTDVSPFGILSPKGTFPQTEKLLALAQQPLEEGRWADLVTVTDAEIALNGLERELSDIRKLLGEAQSKERLRKLLASLIESQQRVTVELKGWQRQLEGEIEKKEPALTVPGPVFLAKGETKKIKLGIRWLQFEKDDLKLKVVSSDPSIVVPAELSLNFEKNQLDYELELRAGNKEGEFIVTVTPEVGKPIELKVTVK